MVGACFKPIHVFNRSSGLSLELPEESFDPDSFWPGSLWPCGCVADGVFVIMMG